MCKTYKLNILYFNVRVGQFIGHVEPEHKENTDAHQYSNGVKDLVGIKVSDYLLDTERQHIERNISIDDVQEHIKAYYSPISKGKICTMNCTLEENHKN